LNATKSLWIPHVTNLSNACKDRAIVEVSEIRMSVSKATVMLYDSA